MGLVVDASVAVKWFVCEEGSERALALAGEDTLIAPELVVAEVANTLWKLTARGVIGPPQAEAGVAELLSAYDELYPLGPLSSRAFGMAVALSHPVYDCFYLALAEIQRATLVTADRRLVAKVAGTPWQDRVRPL